MKKFSKIIQMSILLSATTSFQARAQTEDDGGHLEGSGAGARWVVPTRFERSELVFDQVTKDDKEGFQVTTADGLHTVIRTEVDTVIALPEVANQLAPMELRLRKKSIVQIAFVEGVLSIRNLHDEKNGSVQVAFVGFDKGSRIPLGSVGIFDAEGSRFDSSKPELISVDDKRTMKLYLKDVAILDAMGFYREA